MIITSTLKKEIIMEELAILLDPADLYPMVCATMILIICLGMYIIKIAFIGKNISKNVEKKDITDLYNND